MYSSFASYQLYFHSWSVTIAQQPVCQVLTSDLHFLPLDLKATYREKEKF